MTGRLEVVALPTAHRFGEGDDLAEVLLDAATAAGVALTDGDVVCVASKAVSLAEGATVRLGPGDQHAARRDLARRLSIEVVADTPAVVVTRTRHGFVAANGGIDTSNVADGWALLLPDDPDASAARLRTALHETTGHDIGVVVTDTFGRAWRMGQTDVALGAAGVPVLRDERGRRDLDGRVLEVTEAAVADEVAGAADLVRDKASGAAFVLVRGLAHGEHGRAADLVRPLHEDLFAAGGPTAGLRALAQRRTVRSFDPGRAVPRDIIRQAVVSAATAPAPHHSRPWRFVRLSARTRGPLLDAMAAQWREDLTADGTDPAVVDRRIERSDAILRTAPELLVPFVLTEAAHRYPDERRATAERDLFVLSAGAALQNLQVALAAHGVGAAWISSTAFCAPTVRTVLDLDDAWVPAGMVAVGWPAGLSPAPRPRMAVDDFLIEM